jgi:hypothetical protein
VGQECCPHQAELNIDYDCKHYSRFRALAITGSAIGIVIADPNFCRVLNGIANFGTMHVQLWMATKNVFVPCVIVQNNHATKRIDMLGISQDFCLLIT